MNKKQVFSAILSAILTIEGTPGMPQGVPNLPPLTEMQSKELNPLLKSLFDTDEIKQIKAIVRQPINNQFKGGPKKTRVPRMGLFDPGSVGFWFFDLFQLSQIFAEFNQKIFADYAGFVDKEPLENHYQYHADRMQIPYPDFFRQGETTQDAKDRVLKEAMQCCKAVSEAAAIQLKVMNEVLQEFTYKTADSVPRTTKKKRTRL